MGEEEEGEEDGLQRVWSQGGRSLVEDGKGSAQFEAETALEAFSPGVEKQLCRFFESKNFGVCNAFLHIKLADQLETWHSKTFF